MAIKRVITNTRKTASQPRKSSGCGCGGSKRTTTTKRK